MQLQLKYNIKFIVKKEHFANVCVSDVVKVDMTTNILIVPVFDLLELTDEMTYMGEKCGHQKLVIEPHLLKNIASTDIFDRNLAAFVEQGAKVIDKSEVYDTETDAKIQLAFVCVKYPIKQSDVFRVTGGQLNSCSYVTLVDRLYKDFPEKFV